MRYTIELMRRAQRDIEAGVKYRIEHYSEAHARAWQSGIIAKIESLGEDAYSYPLADEAGDLEVDLREMLYGRKRNMYRVLFVLEANAVRVVRVRHAAQDRLRPTDIDLTK